MCDMCDRRPDPEVEKRQAEYDVLLAQQGLAAAEQRLAMARQRMRETINRKTGGRP